MRRCEACDSIARDLRYKHVENCRDGNQVWNDHLIKFGVKQLIEKDREKQKKISYQAYRAKPYSPQKRGFGKSASGSGF